MSNNHDSPAIVECRELGKTFARTIALADINLSLHAGPPVALIGPNGAGKTTLMSLICGFIRPGHGEVTVLGSSPGSAQALAKIAALPQDALFDPVFSISRQLRHYAQLRGMSYRAARDETGRVLDLVQLGDRGGDKPTLLSHGMRKRVMIAQALIGNPELVLLDEPTAGIDPPNVKIIRDIIASEAAKTTFIISSHNLDELEKVCSSVIQLRNGRLLRFSSIDAEGGAASKEGYISITLSQNSPGNTIASHLESMSGVIRVSQKNPSELAVEYNREAEPDLDIALLEVLSQNNWSYRKLVKGRSLEEQLFTSA